MISRYAQAGSLESGDALVRVAPDDKGTLSLHVESKVSPRFSGAIKKSVIEVAGEHGVTSARLEIIDRGALDFVLRARVATALKRAQGVETSD